MAFGERLAISIAPLFLRIGLGATFLWAGMGKFASNMDVQGQDAAYLANAGVIKPQWSTPPAQPSATPTSSTPANPVSEPPPAPSAPLPPSDPAEKPAESPKETPKTAPTGTPGRPPRTAVAGLDEGFFISPVRYQPPGVTTPYTAKEFPEPVSVPRVHGITLNIIKGATPNAVEGRTPFALLPAFAGQKSWPVTLAYAAAVAATLGGAFLLVGLFTRLSSLILAFTLAVTTWVLVLGPSIQNGNTIYGVVPAYPRFDVGAWQTPLWLLVLMMGSLALFCAGPGALSLDRLIFGRSTRPPPARPASAARPL